MSRFATVKSEDARLDSLSDPSSFGDLDENDPQSVARFVKKMGHEMGEDLGEDLDAAMDEAMGEGEGAGDDDGALMDPGGAGGRRGGAVGVKVDALPGLDGPRRGPLERPARPLAPALGLPHLAVADRVERAPSRRTTRCRSCAVDRRRRQPRRRAAALRGRRRAAAHHRRGGRLRLSRPDRGGRARGGGLAGPAAAPRRRSRSSGTCTRIRAASPTADRAARARARARAARRRWSARTAVRCWRCPRRGTTTSRGSPARTATSSGARCASSSASCPGRRVRAHAAPAAGTRR